MLNLHLLPLLVSQRNPPSPLRPSAPLLSLPGRVLVSRGKDLRYPAFQTLTTLPALGGASTGATLQHNGEPSVFNPNAAAVPEFTPQNYGLSTTTVSCNGPWRMRMRLWLTMMQTTPVSQDASIAYDTFSMGTVGQAMPAAPYNPYVEDHSAAAAAAALGATNQAFFQQNAYATHTQPVCVYYGPIIRFPFLIMRSSCSITYTSPRALTRKTCFPIRGHPMTFSCPRS